MRQFTAFVILLSGCSEPPVDVGVVEVANDVASEPLDSSHDDGPEDAPAPGDVARADALTDVAADAEAPPDKTVELRIDGGFDLPGDSGVVAVPFRGNPQNLLAHQLLLSPLFGIEDASSLKVE